MGVLALDVLPSNPMEFPADPLGEDAAQDFLIRQLLDGLLLREPFLARLGHGL